MRILYLAHHNNGHNDDEGAIGYALEILGHEVVRFEESTAGISRKKFGNIDFILGHKFSTFSQIARLNRIAPYVFWYFDLVNTKSDPSIASRDRKRIAWMNATRRVASLGFCTDGDWVRDAPSSQKLCDLVSLFQGFDERLYVPVDDPERKKEKLFDIYFGGTLQNCGRRRQQWFDDMKNTYGKSFRHSVEAFREDCRDEVDQSVISIAPDFPVTNRYHSNRVYNFCGYGAAFLHPYSERLAKDYKNREEIIFYNSRADMFEWIDDLLSDPEESFQMGQKAQERTLRDHLYRHRCERLIEVVRDRFDIH